MVTIRGFRGGAVHRLDIHGLDLLHRPRLLGHVHISNVGCNRQPHVDCHRLRLVPRVIAPIPEYSTED